MGPPPGPLAVRLTSAIGRADTCAAMDLTKNGEPGFIPHDFPWDGLDCTFPDPSPETMGDSRFMAVKELAAGSVMRTIPIDRSVSFLLVVRDSDDQLFIPSLPFFDMVVNLMESTIITNVHVLLELFKMEELRLPGSSRGLNVVVGAVAGGPFKSCIERRPQGGYLPEGLTPSGAGCDGAPERDAFVI